MCLWVALKESICLRKAVLKPLAFAQLRTQILTLLISVISKVAIVVSIEINVRYSQEARFVLGVAVA